MLPSFQNLVDRPWSATMKMQNKVNKIIDQDLKITAVDIASSVKLNKRII